MKEHQKCFSIFMSNKTLGWVAEIWEFILLSLEESYYAGKKISVIISPKRWGFLHNQEREARTCLRCFLSKFIDRFLEQDKLLNWIWKPPFTATVLRESGQRNEHTISVSGRLLRKMNLIHSNFSDYFSIFLNHCVFDIHLWDSLIMLQDLYTKSHKQT